MIASFTISEFDFIGWVLIPVLIFLARILDVSLGTIRFVFISRGYKRLAPIIGFFEVLVWIVAIGQIMKNLSNPICYLAYSCGFAAGTYAGIIITERLSLGMVMIRILSRSESNELTQALRDANHGVTSIKAEGKEGPVNVIFTIVQRRNANNVIQAIDQHEPKAFYTIEEVGFAKRGWIPPKRPFVRPVAALNRPFRKHK